MYLRCSCCSSSQYTVAVDELVFTTISGVIAVNAVGFLLIPHWTAVLYIFPVIIMLYFNLLGKLVVLSEVCFQPASTTKFPRSHPCFYYKHRNTSSLRRPHQCRHLCADCHCHWAAGRLFGKLSETFVAPRPPDPVTLTHHVSTFTFSDAHSVALL